MIDNVLLLHMVAIGYLFAFAVVVWIASVNLLKSTGSV